MLVMVPIVFLINGFTKDDWLEAFLFALSVAVGLTPEMLPMIVTTNAGQGRGARCRASKVIVKRLNAIQNFGAMDVLCTDKTGTLTQDKIVLERHIDVFGEESDEVLEYAYLNSYYQTGLKNLLDVAVLEHAELQAELKLEQHYRKVDEIPFDFQRRRMSVVVSRTATGRDLLICKGAVEEMLAVCSRVRTGVATRSLPLTDEHASPRCKAMTRASERGRLARAWPWRSRSCRRPDRAYSVADESDLIAVGLSSPSSIRRRNRRAGTAKAALPSTASRSRC